MGATRPGTGLAATARHAGLHRQACVPTAATLSTFKGNAVVQGRAAAFATATVEA